MKPIEAMYDLWSFRDIGRREWFALVLSDSTADWDMYCNVIEFEQ